MLPPLPASRITQNDEGSPTWKPNEIHEEPLNSPPSELYVKESTHQIISSIFDKAAKFKDKRKKIDTSSENPMKSCTKSESCSMEKIDQVLEESIQIQATNDNPNLMLGIPTLLTLNPKNKYGLGNESPRSSDLVARFKVSLISIACCPDSMFLGTMKPISQSQMLIFL